MIGQEASIYALARLLQLLWSILFVHTWHVNELWLTRVHSLPHTHTRSSHWRCAIKYAVLPVPFNLRCQLQPSGQVIQWGNCTTSICDLLWWPTCVSDMYCVPMFVFYCIACVSLCNANAYVYGLCNCSYKSCVVVSSGWVLLTLYFPLAFPTRVCGYDSALIQQHVGHLSSPQNALPLAITVHDVGDPVLTSCCHAVAGLQRCCHLSHLSPSSVWMT